MSSFHPQFQSHQCTPSSIYTELTHLRYAFTQLKFHISSNNPQLHHPSTYPVHDITFSTTCLIVTCTNTIYPNIQLQATLYYKPNNRLKIVILPQFDKTVRHILFETILTPPSAPYLQYQLLIYFFRTLFSSLHLPYIFMSSS